jgi:hypothetical protein
MDLIKLLEKYDGDSYEHGYLRGLSTGFQQAKDCARNIVWEEYRKEEDILSGKIQLIYPDLPTVCLTKRIDFRIEHEILNPRRDDTSRLHDAWMKSIR